MLMINPFGTAAQVTILRRPLNRRIADLGCHFGGKEGNLALPEDLH
jgi:hypothetical protein